MIKLNGVEIKPTIFPDGTSQIWKINESTFKLRLIQEQHIEWDFENEAEFIHVAQLCDLIKAKGGTVDNLHIPYFPYARQDKEVSNNTTFAKSTFMKLLQTLPVLGISTDDIHSDAYSGRIVHNNDPYMQILDTIGCTQTTLVCFPDNGAKERYEYYDYLGNIKITGGKVNFNMIPYCSFTKVRNQDTGHIERLDLNELINIEGETVLLVDDITDGGMTFKLCAEKLLTLGAKQVNLYTTHGIYSKGVQTLRDSGISRIFNRKGEVE